MSNNIMHIFNCTLLYVYYTSQLVDERQCDIKVIIITPCHWEHVVILIDGYVIKIYQH